MEIRELKDFVGEWQLTAATTDVRHPFSTDADGFAFSLGRDGEPDYVCFVFEDEDDGYRCRATAPLVGRDSFYNYCANINYIHRPVTIRHVTASEYGGEADIIEAIDQKTGHTWFRVGTDNIDDYYPSYVAQFSPMDPTP